MTSGDHFTASDSSQNFQMPLGIRKDSSNLPPLYAVSRKHAWETEENQSEGMGKSITLFAVAALIPPDQD